MLRAVIGSGAVLVIPGAVIAYAMRAPFRSLTTWAVVPAFSLAAVFVVGEISDVAPWPFNAWTVAIFVILGLAVTVALRQRTRVHVRKAVPIVTPPESAAPVSKTTAAIARALLVLAFVAGVLILVRGIGSHDLVPPEVDASNHGFFVARVIETQSLDLGKVVVSDAGATHRVATFYPLGMHASAAVASELTGASIGQVLVVFDVLFCAFVFPLGMFVLARWLVPDKPLAAGFTAVVAVALGTGVASAGAPTNLSDVAPSVFPFGAIPFGDVPLVIGMALVPITVVVITGALTMESGRSWRPSGAPIAAAALVALTAVAVHTSQVPLIAALVVLSTLEVAWTKRSARVLRDALVRACICGGIVLVLFGPNVPHLVSGVSERSSVTLTVPVSLRHALRSIVLPPPPAAGYLRTLVALLTIGGGLILLLRRRPAWIIAYALVLGVTLLVWVSKSPVSRLLGAPWYHSSVRLNFNQTFFIALFAGLALAYVVDALARLPRTSPLVASLFVLVVLAATVGWSGVRNSTDVVYRSFSNDARVTDSSLAAFTWLRDHVGKHDVIVNDQNADGSLWMYAFERLRPLTAIKPLFSNTAAFADWTDRMYLVAHLAEIGENRQADALAHRFDAQWVYFDEKVFDLFHHTMRLDALLRNKNLELVFHRGTVYVFSIKALP